MLNRLRSSMQHHHSRVASTRRRSLRNQLPGQIIIVIAQPRGHLLPLKLLRWPAFCTSQSRLILTLSLFSRLRRRIFPLMDSTNRDAVDDLLQTYGETGGINYLDAAAMLPSRLAIEAACAELLSLMFPGFRSEALVSSEDLADRTRVRIRNLHARLKTEICRSLGKIPPDEATEAKAEEVLTAFLKELPAVRRVLWTDIDAAYEGDPAARSYEEIILA